MSKVTSKLLAMILSFAMVFTGITFLGGAVQVNAAEGDQTDTISIKVVDQNGNYVNDVSLICTDADDNDIEFGTTSGEGIATHKMDIRFEYYEEEEEYEVTAEDFTTTSPVIFTIVEFQSGERTGMLFDTVNGEEYTGETVTLTIETEEPAQAPVVTFDAQGGTVDPASAAVDAEGKLASLPEPVYEGYDFLGWFDAAEGGNEVTLDKVYTENTTIFAHWSEAIDVDAPYDANDFTYGVYELGTDPSVNGVNSVYPANDMSYMLPGTKWVVTGFSESGAVKFKAGHTDLVIPAEDPEGRTVQGVGDYAFQAGASNTNPVIKESGLKVTGVTFPEGVMTTENIDAVNSNWASYLGKHGPLTEIGDFFIGYYAFASNDIEGELVIPEGTILITNSAFQANKKITKVTFPSTIVNINKQAFAQCSAIEEVVFPAETDIRLSIRQMAFFQHVMTSVELPKDTVQVQGGTSSAFRGNAGTAIPVTIKGKSSGTNESSNYQTITYQTVSEAVEEAPATCEEPGHDACYKCLACGKFFSDEDLTQEIKDGVIPALGHDWELTEITPPTADSDGEALYTCKNDPSHTKTEVLRFAWEAADFTYNEAGDTVTGLSASGYQKLDWNPDMALPGTSNTGVTVTAVGNNAFQSSASGKADCVKITNVTFPPSITSIGNIAFGMCSIKDLVLPDTITSVGTAAFQSNAGMRSVKLSENMTEIPQGMFSTNAVTGDPAEGIHVVVIPEKVTKIGASAFQGQHVSELTLPAGLKEIGNSAFKNHLLTELEVPAGVTTLGQDVFTFTQEGPEMTLEKVTLHEGLTTIGRRAFGGSKLAEIEIPSSVTSIHNEAFKAQLIPEAQTTVCLIKSDSPLVGSADGACHTFKVLYKVTFTNAECTCEDVVVWTDKDGNVAEIPEAKNADPDRVFVGWFDAEEAGNEVTLDTVFEADTTVYARWRDQTPAEVVEELVSELPTEVTVDDKDAIEEARAAYEALSAEEKAQLPPTTELRIQTAEAKLDAAVAEEKADEAQQLANLATAKVILAADIVDATTAGVTSSKYTKSTYDAFVTALSAAKAALKDPNATVESIHVASTDLQTATDNLKLKAANTMKVTAKKVSLKAATLKKKSVSVAKSKAFTVKTAKGKVTYKKSSGNSKITVASTGKITAKKGLKKGTYSVKVKVTAAGDDNYKPLTKTVTVKVVVK